MSTFTLPHQSTYQQLWHELHSLNAHDHIKKKLLMETVPPTSYKITGMDTTLNVEVRRLEEKSEHAPF